MYVTQVFPTFISANDRRLVFPDILDQGIQFHPIGVRTDTSASTYERTFHSPHHHSVQWFDNREAYNIFGAQTPSG